jgi:chaperonin GroEL
VAIIRVGAATETEMKEKKHRVEDALSAARAAVEEGIVPGGEISLINAAAKLDKLLKSLNGEEENEETRVGINIVKKALEAPIRKLAANAGQDGSVIIDTVRRTAVDKKNKNIGYNVLTAEYVDMIQAGIIDPVKVVRGALENAASIASMILTTDVLITDMPEKEKAPAMPPGGMGGMDY